MQTTEQMTEQQRLILAKLQWEQRQQAYQEALAFLNDTIQDVAGGSGNPDGLSQSQIARTLEWPRQRVSKLLADLAEGTQG